VTWRLDPETGFDRLSLGTSAEALVAEYGEPDRFRRGGEGPEVWFWTWVGLQASVSDDEVVFVEILEPAEVVVAAASYGE
jgi:hypothetical protein